MQIVFDQGSNCRYHQDVVRIRKIYLKRDPLCMCIFRSHVVDNQEGILSWWTAENIVSLSITIFQLYFIGNTFFRQATVWNMVLLILRSSSQHRLPTISRKVALFSSRCHFQSFIFTHCLNGIRKNWVRPYVHISLICFVQSVVSHSD
jgi:hypothetical protein